jgi:hypothetical protein
MRNAQAACIAGLALAVVSACRTASSSRTYQNRDMDFASVQTVAVLPFWNLTQDNVAADRVRDVFSNALLATEAVYVLQPGEVARAVSRTGMSVPATPSTEEIVKLGTLLKVDAIVTGVLKEYGEVRSASTAANVISLSVQMHETATGKVIWSASSTRGGIGWAARLLGTAGGAPMNHLTEQAVDDVIAKLLD